MTLKIQPAQAQARSENVALSFLEGELFRKTKIPSPKLTKIAKERIVPMIINFLTSM